VNDDLLDKGWDIDEEVEAHCLVRDEEERRSVLERGHKWALS